MLTSSFATRAADAMLRALGGGEVVLRIPSAAASPPSTAPAGLGLNPSLTEDVSIAPAVVRPLAFQDGRARIEVVFPAAALAPYLERSGLCVEDFLASSRGIVKGGEAPRFEGDSIAPDVRLLRIVSATVERFAGQEYLVKLEAEE